MTNYPNVAAAAAAQNCRSTYMLWQMAVELRNADDERVMWAQYQKACEDYKRITGNEFAPVRFQAVQP